MADYKKSYSDELIAFINESNFSFEMKMGFVLILRLFNIKQVEECRMSDSNTYKVSSYVNQTRSLLNVGR